MTLTPAQLDAMATKLLGWKVSRLKDWQGKTLYMDKPLVERYAPRPDNRSDAMLVLEAMGKWCGDEGRTIYTVDLSGDGEAWVCEITKHVKYDPSEPIISKSADTLAAAIFQCAAQLVGRM